MPSASSDLLTAAHVALGALAQGLESTLQHRCSLRAFRRRLRRDASLAGTLQAAAKLRDGKATLADEGLCRKAKSRVQGNFRLKALSVSQTVNDSTPPKQEPQWPQHLADFKRERWAKEDARRKARS